MEYVRIVATDSAYIAQQGQRESVNAYKGCIYDTLHILLRETTEPADMRIIRLWPNINWAILWKNLHIASIPRATNHT
jgi:hypothetical protein